MLPLIRIKHSDFSTQGTLDIFTQKIIKTEIVLHAFHVAAVAGNCAQYNTVKQVRNGKMWHS